MSIEKVNNNIYFNGNINTSYNRLHNIVGKPKFLPGKGYAWFLRLEKDCRIIILQNPLLKMSEMGKYIFIIIGVTLSDWIKAAKFLQLDENTIKRLLAEYCDQKKDE